MIHVGHLVSLSTHIFEHIFVIVDAFTKFTLVRTVKSTATRDIIDTLQELARYVGMPSRIVSDQRTAFTSMTSANSVRFNRRQNAASEWSRWASESQYTINVFVDCWQCIELRSIQWSVKTVHNKTGMYPKKLLFRVVPRDNMQNKLIHALQDDNVTAHSYDELKQLSQNAAIRTNDHRPKAKRYYDAKHKPPTM